ncbi:MAG: hypothetical protein M1587_07785 [Thaumarchaeota archaeon]|nr:hypothetical protein [Nitrososphaerota archaeon]MCL5068081.1 hypothetical protein [Nitrososphaerota archaeon]
MVQSRIILSIFIGGTVGASSLLRIARISGSTWKKEKALLIQKGLLSYVKRKEIRDDGIRQVKCYSLTEKGNEVARHVGMIAHLLGQERLPEANTPFVMISE